MSFKKVRRNNVWSNVLCEQVLCDDIVKFTVNLDESGKNEIDRGVESYEISLVDQTQIENNLEPVDKKESRQSQNLENKNQLTDKKKRRPKKNKKKKSLDKSLIQNAIELTKTAQSETSITYDLNKNRDHIQANEFDTDDIVIKEIVKQLNEQKSDLITRCVKVLGRKKCLELLYATQDVESNGGMWTEDGYRKRSPGGIFLQLIKRDETILSMQKKKIFIEDPEQKKRKKERKRLQNKMRFNKAKEDLANKVNRQEELSSRLNFNS